MTMGKGLYRNPLYEGKYVKINEHLFFFSLFVTIKVH
ncbi:hypothetical protein KQ1_05232 [Bacillus cereus BAG3O-1]|nr:hypothetical protein KQ1_05232 [Bacillus cereus BAG3O-1]